MPHHCPELTRPCCIPLGTAVRDSWGTENISQLGDLWDEFHSSYGKRGNQNFMGLSESEFFWRKQWWKLSEILELSRVIYHKDLQTLPLQNSFSSGGWGCTSVDRVSAYHVESPGFHPSHHTNWVRWCTPVIPAPRRCGHNEQKFRVTFGYLVIFRPAGVIWDPVLEGKKGGGS